jgi:hypothetical protein
MENYRGYIIDLCFIYHDPFTKIPTGLVDGMYYREEDEIARGIYRKTIQQVKREIDDLIYEKTEYRVFREIPTVGMTITKFFELHEALDFAKKINGDIRLFINGQEEELSFQF